eukprot:g33020.t1
MLGPKRIPMNDDATVPKPPYKLIPNSYSMLDQTDLVFIDPVSTGYSRPEKGEKKSQFHGFDEDIQSVGQFIHQYVTENQRWSSAKFLLGESYGTLRAAGLSGHLQDRYKMYLNGIVMISSVIDFQTIRFSGKNELPYALFLPSYTATAWYHKRLSSDLQKDLSKTLKKVEEFALGEYTTALMKGDALTPAERKSVIGKLAKYTGLSEEYVAQSNLRIQIFRFTKELLRGERRTVGRLDSRFQGIDKDAAGDSFEYDPSNSAIDGPYGATMNDYVRTELKFESPLPYEVLTGRHTAAAAERTCRVDTPTGRVLKQSEINDRLIAAARAGKTVVRLKGGDPFVFGRGSEEAAALSAAGIAYEVVPGITAATAAGAYAGISFTHRDMASAVAFITGHEDPDKGGSSLDYTAIANFSGTLVFYMGLHRLESIARSLVEHGKPESTPVAVISRATTPMQRVVTGTLADIAESVKSAGLPAPSLIVVGECAMQRDRIAWFEKRPLFGRRIGILRAAEQAEPTIARALELGAQPVSLPAIRILPPEDVSPVDAAIARLESFDWLIFTSTNGVAGLLDRLWETGGDVRQLAHVRLAAIGPSTAEALEHYRLRADVVPESFRAEALAEALKPHVAGKRVLWARASRGRDVLPEELTAAGATVEQTVVYQNIDVDAFPEPEAGMLERGELDWIGLSSPSIARNLNRLLTDKARAHIGTTTRLASISPVTTAAAEESGLPIAVEATDYTWEGIYSAIIGAQVD